VGVDVFDDGLEAGGGLLGRVGDLPVEVLLAGVDRPLPL
jgi:hypothetical protein